MVFMYRYHYRALYLGAVVKKSTIYYGNQETSTIPGGWECQVSAINSSERVITYLKMEYIGVITHLLIIFDSNYWKFYLYFVGAIYFFGTPKKGNETKSTAFFPFVYPWMFSFRVGSASSPFGRKEGLGPALVNSSERIGGESDPTCDS